MPNLRQQFDWMVRVVNGGHKYVDFKGLHGKFRVGINKQSGGPLWGYFSVLQSRLVFGL